jgi:surface antigen
MSLVVTNQRYQGEPARCRHLQHGAFRGSAHTSGIEPDLHGDDRRMPYARLSSVHTTLEE